LEMVENEIKYFVKRLVFDTSKNLRKWYGNVHDNMNILVMIMKVTKNDMTQNWHIEDLECIFSQQNFKTFLGCVT
jgi:hypothetical protein